MPCDHTSVPLEKYIQPIKDSHLVNVRWVCPECSVVVYEADTNEDGQPLLLD